MLHCLLAERPRESVRTCALVGSQSIDAHTTVLTRITGTFVDIDLALFARPAHGTFAVVIESVAVDTASTVETHGQGPSDFGQSGVVGRSITHGDVNLAELAVKTGPAKALVSVITVLAQAAILARVRFAFVNIHFAVRTGKSGQAGTCVGCDPVMTRSFVKARIGPTFVPVSLALVASEAVLAEARVTVRAVCMIDAEAM